MLLVFAAQNGDKPMDRNRIKGSAEQAKGKVKEVAGKVHRRQEARGRRQGGQGQREDPQRHRRFGRTRCEGGEAPRRGGIVGRTVSRAREGGVGFPVVRTGGAFLRTAPPGVQARASVSPPSFDETGPLLARPPRRSEQTRKLEDTPEHQVVGGRHSRWGSSSARPCFAQDKGS